MEVLSRTAAIVIEKEKEARARKQAEQALLQGTESLNKQRRLYEAAISNTPDFIYVFNLEGRFTYVNDALLESWGRTWEEAIGKTCLELGYEQWHADMHMRELEQVIKTRKPIRGDVPFTGANGRRIYDYIFVPVIGDNGEIEAIAGTTRDVTERRQAEENARKAEERQRLALEASHGFGIWEWDVKNNIFTADERLGCLFGLSPEETRMGIPIEKVLLSIHEDDIDRIKQHIEEKVRDGGQYSEEYRIRQTDGSVRWGSFKGRVVRDDNGEAVKFPGVGVDITGEKNAILALQEADRKKDEFLATLAHELRNPLAPIRNALHILKSQSASHLHQKNAHHLIEKQVTQMVRLVDDLMDVSRITRGKINLSTSVFNIEEALIAAIETIQPLIDERQHQLTVNSAEEPVFVHGDLVRLSQVFANILNNAAKYTGINGSITVEVTTTQDAVNIAIADDGAGIPADMLPNIFDMFSQVDDSLEHAQGGLGIGLTLVQQLVALHDGEIRATSDGLGKGSCFTVNLPRCSAPAETAEHNTASEPDDKASLLPVNVLIVDDNQDAAVTMAWILEAMDYRVEVAEDATEALQMVEQFTPDLALLDIGLPGMNGYDLCVALKKNPALAHTMFVAQTGWGQPEHIERSKASGFSYHLVKPVNMSEIKPLLEEVKQILAQQPKH
ncbi:PAS domain S-box protein [Alteromonas pelagimontana]|uniref:histidine kinase n=1 Tax=Alteromonas pelagimontana TaxID=1858656 RepID=A0A6M4MAX2_9ALTE|nr:PAS domain S-box protein [Alteromonas pelagimontana]QJR80322.1 PAS domain S-box protein [Alteromonas pelagimontana]